MTDKALEDYASVKEFSENASHEVQTPLAIIQNKIELLSETEINENQAILFELLAHLLPKGGIWGIFLKLANKHFGIWATAITFAVRIFYKPKLKKTAE